MPDSFPEAFRRYEDWLDWTNQSMPKEYADLLQDMKVWGGRRFRGTSGQQKALKVEARRLNISGIPDEQQTTEARTLEYFDYQRQQEELTRERENRERGEPRDV